MSELVRAVLIMSISGGIVAALLFAVKPFIKNRLPKSTQYYLWLVVIAALLVPVSRLVVFSDASKMPFPVAPIQSIVERSVFADAETRPKPGSVFPMEPFELPEGDTHGEKVVMPRLYDTLVPVFTFIYPFGAAATFLYFLMSCMIFTGLCRRRNRDANAEETAMLTELCGGKRAPRLYRNPLAATPMLIGVFRSALILPDREHTDAQLHAVLLHELTHLRRKDILVKWLSVLACAVHWFNPIVWLVRREIDRACELSCDEAVIRTLDADGKQNYGETLIYVAADSETPRAVLSTTMCEEKKELKERLGAIMKNKKHTRIAMILSVMLIVTVGVAAVALGAGRADETSLKEFEVVYGNVTEYSHSVQFKYDDALYSDYIVDGELQTSAGWRGLKEIGYAIGENNEKYRIFERDGYSIDEFIIVQDDGFMNPATIYKAAPKNNAVSVDYAALSALKTPYVGDASAVGQIVNLLPVPDSRLTQRFISIGDDNGLGHAPHTLTLYYEPGETGAAMTAADFPAGGCEENAVLLFALIDNLQEASFAFRETPTMGANLDKSAYEVRVNYTRDDLTKGGLNWDELWDGETLKTGADSRTSALDGVLDKIYLGMTNEEVRNLFGEPDYQASGLMWYGYNDIGTFDPRSLTGDGVIERISLANGVQWSVSELIKKAVLDNKIGEFLEPEGFYPTESHVILKLDANPRGFTAYVMSLYQSFLPDGEYNVKEVAGQHSPLALTFNKNANGDYEFAEYWEPGNGSNYTPSIRAKFPEDIWDKTDTQKYIEMSKEECYTWAMYHFVGAIPHEGRYGLDGATAFLTGVAESSTEAGYFDIKYFPGATLEIETDEYQFTRGWIVEYADSRKNITVDRRGMDSILITDDLIGIYDISRSKYAMKFERYKKAE